MYVKALKKGFFDTVGNGSFTEIKKGQVFQVPDKTVIKPTSWVVRCDKQGNVIDPEVARDQAKKAREKATREEEQAKAARANADREEAQAKAAEERAKKLEDEAKAKAAGGQGDQSK